MSSSQPIDNDQARSTLAQFLQAASVGGSAGANMGGLGMQMMLGQKTPEMGHEETHQKMTAEQARQDLLAHQQADAQHQASTAQGIIATGDPSDPMGTGSNTGTVGGGPMSLTMSASGDPNDPLRGYLNDQMRNAQSNENSAMNSMQMGGINEGAGIDQEILGKKQELAAHVAEQEAEQPLLHQKTVEAAQFQKQQQDVFDAGQKAYEAQMVRVRSAVAEANQAELKDFWSDASVGAKIFGVLAQALSGAANGLAGNPSAVTPLDRLIEQDMHRQEGNLAQKNKTAYREQGMLGTIQKQTGDRVAALNAMKLAAWDRIERQTAELKGTMGGPVAAAQAETLDGLAKQRKAMYSEKMGQILLEKAQQDKATAMKGLISLDATQAAMMKARALAAQNHFTLVGMKDDGSINKTQYEKASDGSSYYAAYLAANAEMKRIAAEGPALNRIEQKARYDKAQSASQSALRQLDKTGAALSEAELVNINTRNPTYDQVMLPGYGSLRGGKGQLDDAADAMTDAYVAKMRGLGVNSELNVNDPIAGEALTRYAIRHQKAAQ